MIPFANRVSWDEKYYTIQPRRICNILLDSTIDVMYYVYDSTSPTDVSEEKFVDPGRTLGATVVLFRRPWCDCIGIQYDGINVWRC